jgi:AcrR family transcriptional regulator
MIGVMASKRETNEPVQERGRRTRQAILDAAAAAFDEHGYASAALSDIARRAGMTKGSLTFHFPSKALIAATLVQEFEERRAAALSQLDGPGTLDRIEGLLNSLAVRFRDDITLRAAVRLQNERDTIDVELPPPYVGWIAALTTLYAQAEDAGELRPGSDPASLAHLTVATFFGLQHISQALTGRADLQDRIQEFWAVLRPAVQDQ